MLCSWTSRAGALCLTSAAAVSEEALAQQDKAACWAHTMSFLPHSEMGNGARCCSGRMGLSQSELCVEPCHAVCRCTTSCTRTARASGRACPRRRTPGCPGCRVPPTPQAFHPGEPGFCSLGMSHCNWMRSPQRLLLRVRPASGLLATYGGVAAARGFSSGMQCLPCCQELAMCPQHGHRLPGLVSDRRDRPTDLPQLCPAGVAVPC